MSKRTNPGWNLSRATLVLNKVYLETINIEKNWPSIQINFIISFLSMVLVVPQIFIKSYPQLSSLYFGDNQTQRSFKTSSEITSKFYDWSLKEKKWGKLLLVAFLVEYLRFSICNIISANSHSLCSSYQYRCLLFIFLVWLLWLGVLVMCYVKVVRVDIFVLFLILEEKLSDFHPWVWC